MEQLESICAKWEYKIAYQWFRDSTKVWNISFIFRKSEFDPWNITISREPH